MNDIDESEIGDIPEPVLSLYAAKWLGWSSDFDAEPTGDGTSKLEATWTSPDGETHDELPDYCNDDAAAWRLLERMPSPFTVSPVEGCVYAIVPVKGDSPRTLNFKDRLRWEDVGKKRALAEAAAYLAVRGIEPRAVDSG